MTSLHRRLVAALAARPLPPRDPATTEAGATAADRGALLWELADHLVNPGQGWPYPPSLDSGDLELVANWLRGCAAQAEADTGQPPGAGQKGIHRAEH